MAVVPGVSDLPIGNSRVVRVVIPAKVANNIELLQKAVSNSIVSILGAYGCRTCCSGIDIYFTNEAEFVVNEKTLQPSGLYESHKE